MGFESFIGIIGTVVGTILGFLLNVLSNRGKLVVILSEKDSNLTYYKLSTYGDCESSDALLSYTMNCRILKK